MKSATIILLGVLAASVLSTSHKETPAPLDPAQLFDTTTGASKTTTGASKTTTGASKTTTAPSHNTTGPSHTTTGPSHTTTGASKTTTGASKTTTGASKTTTGASKTTTAPSHTTTGAPNTTHVPLKTTTAAAHTSTAPPPAPQPTPHATLIPGNYNVTNEKSEVCLKAHMALRVRLSSEKSKGVFIVQPQLTRAVGGCEGSSSANLTLTFKEGHVTFLFNKSATEDTAYVHALSLALLYPLEGKGGSGRYSADNQSVRLFAAKTGHSYGCNMESVYLGSGLYLDISQDRLQAFNLTKSHDFGPADVCAGDHRDYSVAIGVGVALLVLIVIVLLAYFLSRRRRTGGYQLL